MNSANERMILLKAFFILYCYENLITVSFFEVFGFGPKFALELLKVSLQVPCCCFPCNDNVNFTGAAQSHKNWVGKTSKFNNIYSRCIQVIEQVTGILRFWGIFTSDLWKTGWANAQPAQPVALPLISMIIEYIFFILNCNKYFFNVKWTST